MEEEIGPLPLLSLLHDNCPTGFSLADAGVEGIRGTQDAMMWFSTRTRWTAHRGGNGG